MESMMKWSVGILAFALMTAGSQVARAEICKLAPILVFNIAKSKGWTYQCKNRLNMSDRWKRGTPATFVPDGLMWCRNYSGMPPCSVGEPDFNADISGGGILPGPYLKGVGRSPKPGRLMPEISPVWPPLLPSPIT